MKGFCQAIEMNYSKKDIILVIFASILLPFSFTLPIGILLFVILIIEKFNQINFDERKLKEFSTLFFN